MSTGVRSDYSVAVKKGFHFIKFSVVTDDIEDAVKAYLGETRRTAPYLHSGEVSTIEDLFIPGKGMVHKLGNTNHLEKALIEYVKSL